MMKFYKILLLVIMSIVGSLNGFSSDFYDGGIYYNITNKATNEVEVTYSPSSGSLTIPAVVNYEGVAYLVTSIGDYAFSGSRYLNSVTIPYSVVTIGNYTFKNCTGLTSITIPNSITTIGEYAFFGCSELNKVEISDLTSWCKINFDDIHSNPLTYAGHLYMNGQEIKDLKIPNGITSIIYTFSGCSWLTSVTIPVGVRTIGSHAFYNCSSLTSVTIPVGVRTIGSNAFYNCSSLTSITIPNSVTTIGNYAFENCTGLKSLTIPNSVTTIGKYAFYYCRGLKSLKFSNRVTTIGEEAFKYCVSLREIEISDLASWCKIIFTDRYANPLCHQGHLYINGQEIKSLKIPEGITSINNYAFYNCSGLTSVTTSNSVTTIGDFSFYECKSLTSVTFSNSVITIGNSAFYDCRGLTSVAIPNSVTTIGEEAFKDCSGLINISIGKNIKTIGDFAFEGSNKLNTVKIYATEAPTMSSDSFPYNTATFHVPRGCKAKYAFLYTFGNIIDDLENEEDSVEDIFGDDVDVKVDIYNLNGQIVKLQADKAEVEALKPGLYIINGRKVLIR